MWTNENRARYDRSQLRYPSDLTDAEWAHVESLVPPAKRGGNRRHVDEREVVNGLMYVLSTGRWKFSQTGPLGLGDCHARVGPARHWSEPWRPACLSSSSHVGRSGGSA